MNKHTYSRWEIISCTFCALVAAAAILCIPYASANKQDADTIVVSATAPCTEPISGSEEATVESSVATDPEVTNYTEPETSETSDIELASYDVEETSEPASDSITSESELVAIQRAPIQTKPSANIDTADRYPTVRLTAEEQELLSIVVYLESGSTSVACQQAVTSAILNRVMTSGGSLHDVIYAPNQFSVVSLIPNTAPSDTTRSVVADVLANGCTVPKAVTFFRSDYYHDWSSCIVPYKSIDNVYFSYNTALM